MNISKRKFNISMAAIGAGLITGCATKPNEAEFSKFIDVETLTTDDLVEIFAYHLFEHQKILAVGQGRINEIKGEIMTKLTDARQLVDVNKRLGLSKWDSNVELAKAFDEKFGSIFEKWKNTGFTKNSVHDVEFEPTLPTHYRDGKIFFSLEIDLFDSGKGKPNSGNIYFGIKDVIYPDRPGIYKLSQFYYVNSNVNIRPRLEYPLGDFKNAIIKSKKLNVRLESKIKVFPKLHFGKSNFNIESMDFEIISQSARLLDLAPLYR